MLGSGLHSQSRHAAPSSRCCRCNAKPNGGSFVDADYICGSFWTYASRSTPSARVVLEACGTNLTSNGRVRRRIERV